MSSNPTTPNPKDQAASAPQRTQGPSAERRAQAIVEHVIARRRRGELVTDDQVLRDHPELLGVLEQMLRKAAVVERVRAAAQDAPDAMERLLDNLEDDASPTARPVESLPARSVTTGAGFVDDRFQSERKAAEASQANDLAGQAADAQRPLAGVAPGPSEGPRFELEAAPPRNGDVVQAASPVGFRPQRRPPTAVVFVYDDDQRGGEAVRVRVSPFTIGRHGGDFLVPHDGRMSAKHAVVTRSGGPNGWVWTLRDLQSTNGVFVRVRCAGLRDGDELLMGNRTVRFAAPGGDGGGARLEELRASRRPEKLTLGKGALVLGRGPACSKFLASEPTLDDRFATLTPLTGGGWRIEATGQPGGPSTGADNGLWLRVSEATLVAGAKFQLGEQRFAFHLP
ncbi:MAG: FHA domain-containing protein [Planctomycetota bacterium]